MTDYVQLPSGVVVPDSAFADGGSRPPIGEVATTLDGRDITRGYVDGLPLLPPTDSVLQARGANDYAIYDEVLRDNQVKATLASRQRAMIAKEWEVQPGGTRRRDKQAADFMSEVFQQIRFDAITEKMHYGVFYGYAVAECVWARDGANAFPEAINVRDRKRFGYRPDMQLVMKTTRNPNGEELEARKFWHFNTGATHDDEPYGVGLAHWLYWPVLFKRNDIKFWLIFLEKFGMPTGVGKFPSNATASEKTTLLRAVQAIQADSGIIMPEGMMIELLEAARSGTADYVTLLDRMDAAISKVVLGHSAGADATPGRLGGEDLSMEVRDDLVKADADLICHSANASWIRWLTDWNFPGAAYPQVWRRIEDEPDLKPQAERDKLIFDMGFKPKLDYIQSTYGEGWEERKSEPPPETPIGQRQPPKIESEDDAEFADAQDSDPDYPQVAAETLGRALESAVEEWLDVVRAILDSAGSLEEALAQVAAASRDLDIGPMAGKVGEAMVAAELAGRYEAEQNNDEPT